MTWVRIKKWTASATMSITLRRLETAAPSPHNGYLFHCLMTRCLATLGLGARVVALTSAALDSSCGSHLACVTRVPTYERERLKRGLLSSK